VKIILIWICITITQGFSFGQDSTRVKFKIMTQPTQFLSNDFPLIFEKVFKRSALGLTIAYRPSTQNSGKIKSYGYGLAGIYWYQNFTNDLYNAVTVGVNSKYFIVKKYNLFIEAHLFYRYWWFNNKYAEFDNMEGYRFKATRTERQNVYGLKILFGNSFQFKTKSKIKPIIDLYCGFGVRYKTWKFETFNGTIRDDYYTYKKETGNYWMPTLQGGLKIGIGM